MSINPSKENTLAQLNQLIEINFDAYHGYQEAASQINDQGLKKVFDQYATERQRNAYDLKNQVLLLDGEPDDSGSVKGNLHRAWLGIKSEVVGNTEKAVVEECIRGEEKAVETYEEILQSTTMPASLRTLIAKQFKQIEEALQQLREWNPLLDENQIYTGKS